MIMIQRGGPDRLPVFCYNLPMSNAQYELCKLRHCARGSIAKYDKRLRVEASLKFVDSSLCIESEGLFDFSGEVK